MKVLIVSHPCATAANQAVFAELRRMTGWDVRLVIPSNWKDEFGNVLDQKDWPGLEGRVTKVPVVFNGHIILHFYRLGWGAYLKKESFDVIYMHHEPYALATGQVCLANSRQDAPAAFGFYSAQNISKSYPPPFSWIERFVHASGRFSFPVSSTVADVLEGRKTLATPTICPLPVDPSVYYPRDLGASPFPHGPGETVIGYVGRLVESKGLATLAEALKKLKGLAWHFHVIGTGDYRGTFERLLLDAGIADRVTFHGFTPHLRTPEFLSAFDLLVVPSETQSNWKEQFGRVIVEAMACGTPVVGSDSGEIPVLILASGGGLVFPERDADALSDCIRRLIGQPELRRQMALRGKKWVGESATLQVVARRMAGAMEEAAGLR
ncbi:MAG: glycosyltransferase [Verrucomicrobiota bacterium]